MTKYCRKNRLIICFNPCIPHSPVVMEQIRYTVQHASVIMMMMSIGRTQVKFIQLKRCARFADLIIVSMEPRINVSYCCWVTSCTGSLGSQNSLYRGQIQKLVRCCQTIFFVNNFNKSSYNKRNHSVWFLTTLNLLWNLTPVQTILWPLASCTGCDPAAIWNIDPWLHTNISRSSNLVYLFRWIWARLSMMTQGVKQVIAQTRNVLRWTPFAWSHMIVKYYSC